MIYAYYVSYGYPGKDGRIALGRAKYMSEKPLETWDDMINVEESFGEPKAIIISIMQIKP